MKNCTHNNVDYGLIDRSNMKMSQHCICLDCGMNWYDVYSFDYFQDRETGEMYDSIDDLTAMQPKAVLQHRLNKYA